jgi:hypothetical protein
MYQWPSGSVQAENMQSKIKISIFFQFFFILRNIYMWIIVQI